VGPDFHVDLNGSRGVDEGVRPDHRPRLDHDPGGTAARSPMLANGETVAEGRMIVTQRVSAKCAKKRRRTSASVITARRPRTSSVRRAMRKRPPWSRQRTISPMVTT
jgi:hypothetical protein